MSDETQTEQPQPSPSPETTDDLLRQLLAERAEDRASLAALQEEIHRDRQQAPRPVSSVVQSQEDLAAARAEELSQHDFYCPGCGRLYDYRRECSGRGEAPHPPLEVVSTDELKQDDTSKHTAAPGVNP